MELVEKQEASWAKQPYHAAERLNAGDARDLVTRGLETARRIAVREMRTSVERARDAGHEVAVGPPWGKDQKDASLAAMIALQGRALTLPATGRPANR